MITVYKRLDSSNRKNFVKLNDVYFNQHTSALLDDRAVEIIRLIDHSEMIDRFTIRSRFDGMTLNIDKLSTGCKTILNIVYNPDYIFDIRECGDNALDVIYSLPYGRVYCDYPMISFGMTKVTVYEKKGLREIDSYEELKEWWKNED